MGAGGIKVIGLIWLAVSVAFGILAVATLMRGALWQPIAYAAIGLSTALCLVGWPEVRLGFVANAVIPLLIVIGGRAGWL